VLVACVSNVLLCSTMDCSREEKGTGLVAPEVPGAFAARVFPGVLVIRSTGIIVLSSARHAAQSLSACVIGYFKISNEEATIVFSACTAEAFMP